MASTYGFICAAGLLFGTIITLLMLPSAVYCISDLRVIKNRIANKFTGSKIVDRSEIEPRKKITKKGDTDKCPLFIEL